MICWENRVYYIVCLKHEKQCFIGHAFKVTLFCMFKGCESGLFGTNCSEKCQCKNDATCDHISGECFCQTGWNGTFCEKRKSLYTSY